MALHVERLEALAPDQASLNAARKLLSASHWPRLETDGHGLAWGECQGSGATPYRVVISEADAGYKCSCPSRKFPCKHSLALMWMRAEAKVSFATAEPPDWVKDWLSRRRGPAAKAEEANEAKPKPSIAAAAAEAVAEPDPKSEARAAAQREKNRKDREAAILAGLEELDVWLADQVERGMAVFVSQCTQVCKVIAQRLVDAKASGLAARLEALPSRLFGLPDAAREMAAVEELGQVYLIVEAYRRQQQIAPLLQMDVRRAVGWNTTREELLADATALRVRATWRVIATMSEVQPDRLRRIETWLWCEQQDAAPRFALLLDFIPVATGTASGGCGVGDRLEAELVFYPSATPLRALLVTTTSSKSADKASLAIAEGPLETMLAAYEAALCEQPWVGTWPLTFRAGRVRRAGEALFLCDATSESAMALPLRSSQWEMALPLTRLQSIDGVGLWDGYRFTLCWAETELGRWTNA